MNLKMDGLTTLPVGPLSIVGMKGCEDIAAKVDWYIAKGRREYADIIRAANIDEDYVRDCYLLDAICPRFGSGEGKGLLRESVRGHDIFIICDMFNYGVTYEMYGIKVPMSPDDHFQDLKRIIAAAGGKARRITVIMPMLYEGRQHKRSARESLDCALALRELCDMGVENIITFDAHDPRVQNAIPLSGFENVQTSYQFIKAIVNTMPGIKINRDSTMIISPDEGGMSRCIYYASVLGLDLGMFYKQRDYTKIQNGRNPILSHEYLGTDMSGKDVIVVDDIISSGDSILDIFSALKERKAGRIFVFASFGLFNDGLARFDKAYEQGLFDKIFTTNLIYRSPELSRRPWYSEVSMSKYIAYIINTINHDMSLSNLLNPAQRIKQFLAGQR